MSRQWALLWHVLHNICILNHDEVGDFIREETGAVNDDNDFQVIQDHEAEGVMKRDRITRSLCQSSLTSARRRMPPFL